MFGFGKQKKDSYQETNQDDYFYDEYDEEYEDDYRYEPYPEEEYERPIQNYREYDPDEPRSRHRTASVNLEQPDTRYNEKGAFSEPKEEAREKQKGPLQQEVERLEETITQLKHQLEVKQSEMATMATALSEKDQALQQQKAKTEQLQEKQQETESLHTKKDHQIQELSNQIQQLKADMTTSKTDQMEALSQAQQQVEELKRTKKESEDMKAELATILIETKKQERAILERAEYEAKGIRSQAEQEAHQVIHDASLELRVMKQEIKNYRKRLRSVQEETTQFFARLLANSDALLEDE